MTPRLTVFLTLSILLAVSACMRSGTPAPVTNPDGTYPLETRTGIEDIDAVLAAVESGDHSQLRRLIKFTTAPCTTRDGLGGPPKCRGAETEGTLLDVFPSVGSEGSFIREAEIDNWTGIDAEALYAVYRVSKDGVDEQYYPRGEYAAVFTSQEAGVGVTLRIEDGMIVRVDYPFYSTLKELKDRIENDASEVIILSDIR